MTLDEWLHSVTILDCDRCGVWTVTIATEIEGRKYRLCQHCRDCTGMTGENGGSHDSTVDTGTVGN